MKCDAHPAPIPNPAVLGRTIAAIAADSCPSRTLVESVRVGIRETRMALYSANSQRYVDTIPHCGNFELRRSRLTSEQFDAICNELRGMIDGNEVHTAGWIPGNNWVGTPWEPIYTDACPGSREASGCSSGCSFGSSCLSTPIPGASDDTRRTEYPYGAWPISDWTIRHPDNRTADFLSISLCRRNGTARRGHHRTRDGILPA